MNKRDFFLKVNEWADDFPNQALRIVNNSFVVQLEVGTGYARRDLYRPVTTNANQDDVRQWLAAAEHKYTRWLAEAMADRVRAWATRQHSPVAILPPDESPPVVATPRLEIIQPVWSLRGVMWDAIVDDMRVAELDPTQAQLYRVHVGYVANDWNYVPREHSHTVNEAKAYVITQYIKQVHRLFRTGAPVSLPSPQAHRDLDIPTRAEQQP